MRTTLWHLAICVVLGMCGPVVADEAFTAQELTAYVADLDAMATVSGDYAQIDGLAREVYQFALRDFGAESAQAIEVERVIVVCAVLMGKQDAGLDLARQMMEKAKRVLPADSALAYRAAAVYGLALQTAGEGQDALGFLSEAVAEGDRWLAPHDLALDELRMVLAQVAVSQGAFDTANSAYQRMDERLSGVDTPQAKTLHALAMLGWAQLAQEMGDAEAAVSVLQEAIVALDAQFADIPRPRMVPVRLKAVANLANALILTGRQQEVPALLRPLLPEVIQVYGADSSLWADLAFSLAIALANDDVSSPDLDEASMLLGRVVEIWQQVYSADTEDLVRAHINYAMVLAAKGQMREALAQIKAMDGQSLSGSQNQIVFVLHEAQLSGEISEQEAVDVILHLMQDTQSEGAAAAQRLLSQRLAAGSAEIAGILRASTDTKGRLQSAQDQLAQIVSLPSDQRDPSQIETLRAEISHQYDEQARLGQLLRDKAPEISGAGFAQEPLSLAEIRRRIGPDAALVLIATPQDETDPGLIIAVSDTAVDWHTFQVPASQVGVAIASLRHSIDLRLGLRSAVALNDDAQGAVGAQNPQDFDFAAAHWLYQQLLGQVAAVISNKSLLYFDLRGSVAALPPQLMVQTPALSQDPAQTDWLIRHHAIIILPAIASLPMGLSKQPVGSRLLAFADPVFGFATAAPAILRGNLAALPETAGEVRDVAAALGQGRSALRLGAGASEAALKAADLGQVGTLYFATHGLMAGDQVEGETLPEPALALSAGGGEDGFLMASEIAELKLNAGLVVLSACNTAAGDGQGSETLSGLAQAFLYAGARGLMVSHWPVESRSAVALMSDLFAIRAQNPGLGLARAQQAAILQMIDNPPNPRWSHPAYWAPFVVVGNPE